MEDIRQWRADPAAMVEWLLGAKWQEWFNGTQFLRVSDNQGTFDRGVVKQDGWRGAGERGPETGDAGIRAASLAILASRPVWRMPSGGDILLGRYPTAGECIRHPSAERVARWCVCYSASVPSCIRTSVELADAEALGCDAPLYCIPLRPDGLPGGLKP